MTAPEKRSGEENEKTANSEEENAEAEKNVAKTEKPRRTKTPTIAKTEPKPKSAPTRPEPVASSQLENIRLIVVFKDGAKIEQPMSDVLKVGVDKGILTIIYKNGSIGRYSILDVAKMTIE